LYGGKPVIHTFEIGDISSFISGLALHSTIYVFASGVAFHGFCFDECSYRLVARISLLFRSSITCEWERLFNTDCKTTRLWESLSTTRQGCIDGCGTGQYSNPIDNSTDRRKVSVQRVLESRLMSRSWNHPLWAA